LRGASFEVFEINFLGLGKREPVRQLKKAGVILKLHQQILAHKIRTAKLRISQVPGKIISPVN
jgi:hypothetical protein